MGKYFGTDGFRGEAGITLTADHAYKAVSYTHLDVYKRQVLKSVSDAGFLLPIHWKLGKKYSFHRMCT